VAKAKTLEHPKTLDLADALGIMDCFALGIMEAFWHHVAAYYADGEITGMKPTVMARSIRYTGDAQELLEAIVEAGFVDRVDDRLIVHAWSEHCNDSVHLTLARAHKYFADGTTPRTSRLSNKEREPIEEWFKAHPVRTESAREAHELPDEGEIELCARKAHDVRTTKPSQAINSLAEASDANDELPSDPDDPESEIIEAEVISGNPFPTVQRVLQALSKAMNQPPPTDPMVRRYIGRSSSILRLVDFCGEELATNLLIWCARWKTDLGYAAVFSNVQQLLAEAEKARWGQPGSAQKGGWGDPAADVERMVGGSRWEEDERLMKEAF